MVRDRVRVRVRWAEGSDVVFTVTRHQWRLLCWATSGGSLQSGVIGARADCNFAALPKSDDPIITLIFALGCPPHPCICISVRRLPDSV